MLPSSLKIPLSRLFLDVKKGFLNVSWTCLTMLDVIGVKPNLGVVSTLRIFDRTEETFSLAKS